jgi:hypothetical protein
LKGQHNHPRGLTASGWDADPGGRDSVDAVAEVLIGTALLIFRLISPGGHGLSNCLDPCSGGKEGFAPLLEFASLAARRHAISKRSLIRRTQLLYKTCS